MRFKQVNSTEPHRYTITASSEHLVNCGIMDLTDTTKGFRCVWGCVKNTIIGLPIKLTMWGEMFQEFLDAFYDPDSEFPFAYLQSLF